MMDGSARTDAERPFGLVSVIIANYNYAEFLRHAIDSALALDWPELEVIVVDDGSSDASRAVIESYGERIAALFLPHEGQVAAYNAGFSRSRGEVVILLDADDLLDRALPRKIAKVWRPGISKVQVQMRVIDAAGRSCGSLLPQYDVVPTPEQIRTWMLATADYPTPPGSGNAYARSFLEQIFPLSGFDRAADSHCITAAPYLGDVVTLAEPLVSYRVHGKNAGAMSEIDAARLGREVARIAARARYGRDIARSVGLVVSERAQDQSLRLLAYRLASLRLAPGAHPVAGDTRARVLSDAVAAFRVPQGWAMPARASFLGWMLLVALLPQAPAEALVRWRFVSGSRPRALRRLLRGLRVVKGEKARE
jgi:glycosyltransferase involved in cell wall biosynthesis